MVKPLLHGLNLNALVALDALLTERNVTRAARRTGITQPAMSQSLARLRELFDDPLLVRSGRGLKRTPRAEAMLEPLADALQAVERAVQLGLKFDPATSRRIFRVAMTDLHLALTLPALLRTLEREAPGVRLEAEPLSLLDLMARIAEGDVDIAIGFLLESPHGIRSVTLFQDDYVCLVRRGHRLSRRKRLTVADYGEHGHLANTPVRFVPRAMADDSYGFTAREGIRASLPYLLALPAVVRSTDLVATVPRRVLDAPIDFEGVVVLEAPPELPPVEHSIWWHPRFDGDPAHKWLRELAIGAARGAP
jgi:DNA-binding transcriptional LysR family regulator